MKAISQKPFRTSVFPFRRANFWDHGASGSGKTTLLNCISTIDTVSAGHIYLEGTDVTELPSKFLARFRRENLGFVFQDFNLLDTLTISENIALALAINRAPPAYRASASGK